MDTSGVRAVPTMVAPPVRQRTPHKTWVRETRLQDPHPQARRSAKSEVRIEVARSGESDFWAAVVRYGRGYGWPSISIRATPRGWS